MPIVHTLRRHLAPAANLMGLIVGLMLPLSTSAQSDSVAASRLRLERIASAGRLWGTIKYFHPYLAYKPIVWDSAFIRAYPGLAAANSRSDFVAAVNQMLGGLGDPATRVVENDTRQARDPDTTFVVHLPDSTVVLRFRAIGDLMDFPSVVGRLTAGAAAARSAERVILDLRGTSRARDLRAEFDLSDYIHDASLAPALDGFLVPESTMSPAYRVRILSGLPFPNDGTVRPSNGYGFFAGGYYQGFQVSDGVAIRPLTPGRAPRVAAIVDQRSTIPDVLFALSERGTLAVVAVGGTPPDAGILSHTVRLAEGVTVEVRLSEPSDRRDVFAADTIVSSSIDPAMALTLARELLRRPTSAPRSAVRGPGTMPAIVRPELEFAERAFPDSALRVLAALRFWMAIHLFSPHKAITGENWDSLLPGFVARMERATDSLDYAVGVVEMVRRIHDSHGSVTSRALDVARRPGMVPARVSIVEGRPIVTAILDTSATSAGLRLGDEIISVDGESAATRLKRLDLIGRAASNDDVDRDFGARMLLRGQARLPALLQVRGSDGKVREVRARRMTNRAQLLAAERPGPSFRVLANGLGYVDLEKLTLSQVDSMFARLRDAPGIIFDMRGYPQLTFFPISARLARQPNRAIMTLERPVWFGPDTAQRSALRAPMMIPASTNPRYAGRTVILVNSRTQSQAETTVLALVAANGTTVIGSQTAGANGEVSQVILPGGLAAHFTGADVRYPDGRPTQRVGVKVDVQVRPTIAGVRAGKDEVLEAAISHLSRPSKP